VSFVKTAKRNVNFVKTAKSPSDGQSAFDCKGDSWRRRDRGHRDSTNFRSHETIRYSCDRENYWQRYPCCEAEQTVAEEEDIEEDEEDYSILIPTKPSHLDFEKSTVFEADMPMMMKLGYFGEAEKKLVRFAGEETPQHRRMMK
jgi:hypothetical protein